MPQFTIVTHQDPNDEVVTVYCAYEAADAMLIPDDLLRALRARLTLNTQVYIYATDPDPWVLYSSVDKRDFFKWFASALEFELWISGEDVEAFRARREKAEYDRQVKMLKT
jgi:hypothetical protein